MTGSGVHDESCGLVDDQRVVVLVEHVELDRLGCEPGWHGGRHLPAETIAGVEPAGGARRPVVEAHVPVDDQPVYLAAALSRNEPGQVLIEARGVGRDGVVCRLAQARRDRPRQTVPIKRTTTPTLIAESATLKIG